MKIGITGTPGVGKHTITLELAKIMQESLIIDINKIILSNNFLFSSASHDNNSFEVDIQRTNKFLATMLSKDDYQNVIVIGHLLPYVIDPLQIDIVIVLRRSPYELKKIYESRSYLQNKINDNLISEILGTIFYDSIKKFGKTKISELEVTITEPVLTNAQKISDMCLNKGSRNFGRIDWLSSVQNDPEMLRLLE